jgi:hypothetical protein
MPPRARARKFVWMFVLGLTLGACGSQKESAQVRIGEIVATLSAAGADASKYIPDQLKVVQENLSGLQAAYDAKDYAAVLSAAPAVLERAQGLTAAASAAKLAFMKALNEQWSGLAATLPGELAAVQNRIDQLAGKSSKKPPAGIDLATARAGLADASSLWSKAQAAFASDNLREAVSTAQAVGSKLQSVAAALQLNFGAVS